MKAAAENLTPVTLELGGKSPVIIEKTANIKEAARRIAWGKLMNAGQTCVAPDYVLVDESRKQQFLTEMKTAFSHLYGKEIKKNPDFGRIVNERHMERLQKYWSRMRNICSAEERQIHCNVISSRPFWISERIRMRRLCRKNCSVRYCRFCHTTSWKMQYVL